MTTPPDDSAISVRPGGWSVVLLARRPLFLSSIALFACLVGFMWPGVSGYAQIGLLLCIAWALVALVIGALDRDARLYELTGLHATTRTGVVKKDSGTIRLADVRTVRVHRSLAERLLGLETIVLSTAGGTLVWRHARTVDRLAEKVQSRIARIRNPGDNTDDFGPQQSIQVPETQVPESVQRIPVIGIAGGIGSGKSAVAAALGNLGCLVIDSDARAKAALDHPEVRDQLVRWWGGNDESGILTDGRVDRAKVASIVFSNPDERRKLENLVHPIVRQERAAIIADAKNSGARAAVVDAPLLFEAGVDRECDVVIFVDAPRAVRLQRVAQTRGWSEAELDRRENTQLALDIKQSRSQYVVDNAGAPDSIGPQVEEILRKVLESSVKNQRIQPAVGDNSTPP